MLRPKVPSRSKKRQRGTSPCSRRPGPGRCGSGTSPTSIRGGSGRASRWYEVIDMFSRRIVGFRVRGTRGRPPRSGNVRYRDRRPRGADCGARRFRAGDEVESTAQVPRPHASSSSHDRACFTNDNPFFECGFRTIEYRPGYPPSSRTGNNGQVLRRRLGELVQRQHERFGIALFSPAQVHDGSWKRARRTRDHALQRCCKQHPGRFRQPPVTPSPADHVGIELPRETANISAA